MLLKNLANETSRKYAGVKVGNLTLSSLYKVKYDLKRKFLYNIYSIVFLVRFIYKP
jgi:hypothetical protein